MFAPQNQQPNVIDSMSGSMEEWYNAIDDAVKKSDVIPGNYEYTVATSYGNVGQIHEDSSTYFDVTCDRFKVISLDNSFITVEQHIKLGIPDQTELKSAVYYIGYKYAADVIDQYRIYSNTDLIQTQNHARYEWFMQYNSISDEAKENSDLFATLHKVRTMNPMVPGSFVDLGKVDDQDREINVQINLRIPLSAFLTLFNLRFYPNWAGKLSIEIYPSYKNLVIAPVIPEETLNDAFGEYRIDKDYDPPNTIEDKAALNHINFGFRNVNQLMVNQIGTSKQTTTDYIAEQTFTCNGEGCYTDKCKIRLATYLLKMDIFNALAAKYIQVPLLFPIQTVQIKDFTNELQKSDNGTDIVHINTANTLALKHCDAMFAIFRNGEYARTCFENPFISYQFNIDGKLYPREQCDTYEDARCLNNTLDALNINNSLITSISKDLRTSLQPYTNVDVYDENTNTLSRKRLWSLGDYSNFMIGIPLADSEDFMGGISTSGTVQIELVGDRKLFTDISYRVTAICFEDKLLKIRAVKPDGRSQIEITGASIEQILAGQAI